MSLLPLEGGLRKVTLLPKEQRVKVPIAILGWHALFEYRKNIYQMASPSGGLLRRPIGVGRSSKKVVFSGREIVTLVGWSQGLNKIFTKLVKPPKVGYKIKFNTVGVRGEKSRSHIGIVKYVVPPNTPMGLELAERWFKDRVNIKAIAEARAFSYRVFIETARGDRCYPVNDHFNWEKI